MDDLADVTGVARCSCRKHAQDDVDRDVWAALEADFPGFLSRVHELRGPGERLRIPHSVERPRARARRVDDGQMAVTVLAALAGVGYATAWRARHEKSRV